MVKFRISLPMEQNTYQAPTRPYTFKNGEWQDVTTPEDIEFFRSKRQFEEYKLIKKPVKKKSSVKKKISKVFKK